MQIPSIPPPLITNPLPQDITAKAVPGLQASAPLMQKAVSAPPKSEKSNQNRGNKDKMRDENPDPTEDRQASGGEQRGGNVNIDV